MSMSKESQIASLYNLKSQVDGTIDSVRASIITFDQALAMISQTAMTMSERNAKNTEPREAAS